MRYSRRYAARMESGYGTLATSSRASQPAERRLPHMRLGVGDSETSGMQRYNLLTDQLIRTRTNDHAPHSMSLPNVYSALMRDEVAGFPALRSHQRHPWHAFLVQLGALAVHRVRPQRAAYGPGRMAATHPRSHARPPGRRPVERRRRRHDQARLHAAARLFVR